MGYLDRKYEGFVLPELPPKEGIKSNLSYFWGVDESFLNDRQQKLEELLNALLTSKHLRNDECLLQFLRDQNFEMEAGEGSTMTYLRSMSSMSFSVNELKNYGMAYDNYLTNFRQEEVSTVAIDKYK